MISQNKRVIAATIGTILEWAEYSFYGYMAYKISGLFFPAEDATVGMIATFGIFAAGFLMRPLGGVLFGHMGDRVGRKSTLVLSIYLMALATIGIGLLPTYAEIGIWAPILLLSLRLIQGLAVAGEFNGASIFLIEHAPKDQAYLAGCWAGAAAAAGMLLGAFSAAIVTLPSMPDWAWRLPFLLGFVGCLVALYLRKHTSESPAFHRAKAAATLSRAPLLDVLRSHKLGMLQVAAFAAFIGIWVYLCNLFYKSFLIQSAGVDPQTAAWVTTFGQALVVIAYPLVGYYADKLGGIALMKQGLIGGIFIAPLIFALGFSDHWAFLATGQVLYAVINAAVGAPMFKYLYDQFPTTLRYTGLSFTWSLSVAVFGGTAPMVAQALLTHSGWHLAPGLYVSTFAIIAVTVLSLGNQTNTRNRFDEYQREVQLKG